MDTQKVRIERDNISPQMAEIVDIYFVDRCNNKNRPNSTFNSAYSEYNEDTKNMIVEAEPTSSTSLEVGRQAIERAFKFAEDMQAS